MVLVLDRIQIGSHEVLFMSKLSTAERAGLPPKDFAGPDKSYPINDASHGRNALARVAQHGTPALKKRVTSAVKRKYPDMQVA